MKFIKMKVPNEKEMRLPHTPKNRLADAIRFLSVDAVEKANSGHPGLPLGMADVVTVLHRDFLQFNPKNPNWINRDLFILSAGHGSILLYSLLYLTGYTAYTIDALKNFRKINSLTPGHPEYGSRHEGIETTTGPLGQGVATAVGMAIAQQIVNAQLIREGRSSLAHKIYILVSDGDLMEGIVSEALSLAGHLQLSNLILLYDDNQISIDGPTSLSFSDDTEKRFEAYHFNVEKVDGHNEEEIYDAFSRVQNSSLPSVVICRTIIGKGAPSKEGTSKCHGSPLGRLEIETMRQSLDWPFPPFEIPERILNAWREIGKKSEASYKKFQKENCDLGAFFDSLDVDALFETIATDLKQRTSIHLSTRQWSEEVLEHITPALPFLVGGSADLTPSNNTKTEHHKPIKAHDFEGNYIHYGVREHAMGAAMNGICLYYKSLQKGLRISFPFLVYGGTFLCFSDYMRPSVRLSALMKLPTTFVWTHDSIALGEDGPTHQPVEHLSALRAIPNLQVLRPCDAFEVSACWKIALLKSLRDEASPTAIILTRQAVESFRQTAEMDCVQKGGYIVQEEALKRDDPDVTIMASGSEVFLALQVQKILEETEGLSTRVISVPWLEGFKDLSILKGKRVVIEAGIAMSWGHLLREGDLFLGVETFGASGTFEELMQEFGLEPEVIAKKIMLSL